MIKAILFDMDGVLIDSEPLHCKAYVKAFKEFNIPFKDEEYYTVWTQEGRGLKGLISDRQLSIDKDVLYTLKQDLFFSLLKSELIIYPGALDLVHLLRKHFNIALATGTPRRETNVVLEQTKLENIFQVITTGDQVPHRKPHPAIFLRAAEELGIEPQHCLVIEDAQKGIEAAHSAGMKSIAIATKYTQNHDFSKAECVVNSIKEITLELIKSL